MKNLKNTLVAAVILGCAGAAHADLYSYTASASTSPSSPFYPNESGSTTFTFTLNGAPGDHTTTWAANDTLLGSYYDFEFNSSVFSTATIVGGNLVANAVPGGTYTEGTTYTVIVDWTINSTVPGIPKTFVNALTFDFDVSTPAGDPSSGEKDIGQGLPFRVIATPVPEPAQAIASVALLGCGGLVFIGRRFIKKQS